VFSRGVRSGLRAKAFARADVRPPRENQHQHQARRRRAEQPNHPSDRSSKTRTWRRLSPIDCRWQRP
jgi:hypothetical protein